MAAEFISQKLGQITLLALANSRSFCHCRDGLVHILDNVVMKFFVLPGKPACLPDLIAHSERLRGTNGTACSRDAAMDASDSVMKLTGNSG